MARTKKFTATDIKNAIRLAGISPAAVAKHLGVTPRTVRNYLNEFQLWDELKVSQDELKQIAVANIMDAVENGDVPLSQWVLERLEKEVWSKRSEVTGADGESLIKLPPDVMKAVEAAGLDLQAVGRAFTAQVRAYAEQKAAQERGDSGVIAAPHPQNYD